MDVAWREARRTEVVEGVEDDVELLEPRDVVLGFLDIVVNRRDLDTGIECRGSLGCNLFSV